MGIAAVLRYIPSSAFSTIPTRISIEDHPFEIKQQLFALHNAFPNSIHLSVSGSMLWFDMQYLSLPADSDTYLFPNLKHLAVTHKRPGCRELENTLGVATARAREQNRRGHAMPLAVPLESIHFVPETSSRLWTYFQKQPKPKPKKTRMAKILGKIQRKKEEEEVLEDPDPVVLIKFDASDRRGEMPVARDFFKISESHGPLYPPDDGRSWVEEVAPRDASPANTQVLQVQVSLRPLEAYMKYDREVDLELFTAASRAEVDHSGFYFSGTRGDA